MDSSFLGTRAIGVVFILSVVSPDLSNAQQLMLGASVGVSRSTITHLGFDRPRRGRGAGVLLGVQAGDISVLSGVNVVQKGADGLYDNWFHVSYTEVPLVVNWSLPVEWLTIRPTVHGGFALAFEVCCTGLSSFSSIVPTTPGPEFCNYYRSKETDASLLVGAGLETDWKPFFVFARTRYAHGIVNLLELHFNQRHRTLSADFGVAFRFRLWDEG